MTLLSPSKYDKVDCKGNLVFYGDQTMKGALMQRLTFWFILSLVTVIPLVSVIAWRLQVSLAKV